MADRRLDLITNGGRDNVHPVRLESDRIIRKVSLYSPEVNPRKCGKAYDARMRQEVCDHCTYRFSACKAYHKTATKN